MLFATADNITDYILNNERGVVLFKKQKAKKEGLMCLLLTVAYTEVN